jgi:hypothetical protein
MDAAVDISKRETETIEVTARRYGIGRNPAYDLARRGELPGVIRLGRRLVVVKAVTDRVLREGSLRPRATDGSEVVARDGNAPAG